MQQIIPPVSRDLLKRELTPDKRLRTTNKSNNEIYIVTYKDSPNVLREIGRLREIAFRTAGGGTGKDCDLDEFDVGPNAYYQLIVWCPQTEEILGGYRFIFGKDIKYDSQGQPILATGHMFHFSKEFIEKYMDKTVELGRSFVTLEYQSSQKSYKSLYALDNLWDGLGALTIIMPETKYFFGKMTMYPSFNRQARDMILFFLHKHFADNDHLVTPICPLQTETPEEELRALFNKDNFKEDYYLLNTNVRKTGFNIPPLVNAYMGLSPTMRVFGTAVNHEFGEVEETGILIAVDEILEQKRMRHIDSFVQDNPESMSILKDIFIKE